MEFYLGILLGLVALIAIVWTFVRSRVGDEPHCRGCGFSLAGLTEPEVCPECGRSLSRRRAVVVGERRSRKRLVIVFAVLGGLSSALLWLDRANRRGFIPVNEYKPAWLLIGEAYLLGDDRASAATDEIVDRIQAGELNSEHQDKLLSIALRRHAQTWRGFPDSQWGVIAEAIAQGQLAYDQIERVWLDVCPEVVLLDPQYGTLRCYPDEEQILVWGAKYRMGSTPVGAFTFNFDNNVKAMLQIDGTRPDIFVPLGITSGRGAIRASANGIPYQGNPPTLVDDVFVLPFVTPSELGLHNGYVDIDFGVIMHTIGSFWPNMPAEQADRLTDLRRTFSLPIKINVVETGVDDNPVVEPEELARNTASLLQFDIGTVFLISRWDSNRTISYRLRTTDSMDRSVGYGGVVVFRQGENEVRVGTKYNGHGMTEFQEVALPGFVPGEVRVHYEYDVIEARKSRTMMERVLGGRVELGVFELPGVPDGPADP